MGTLHRSLNSYGVFRRYMCKKREFKRMSLKGREQKSERLSRAREKGRGAGKDGGGERKRRGERERVQECARFAEELRSYS